jgi:hypothetical protein
MKMLISLKTNSMKYSCSAIIIVMTFSSFKAPAVDGPLRSEDFFLHKKDKLKFQFFMVAETAKARLFRTVKPETGKYEVYEGAKKTTINISPNDSIWPMPEYGMQKSGLALLHFSAAAIIRLQKNDNNASYPENENVPVNLNEFNSMNTTVVRERCFRYDKILIQVDNNSPGAFHKTTGDAYEIVLKDNPYNLNISEDITAGVYFNGKPVKNRSVQLNVTTEQGNRYSEKLVTDADGQVYLHPSHEGVYVVTSVQTLASTEKGVDFDTWSASYTFAFKSIDKLPNTYKEFGLGNFH